MSRIGRVWNNEQIENYYLGIKYSDYPSVFWDKIKVLISDCRTLTDIGCGPGAFTIKAAEFGMKVQAIDVNKKHLQVLEDYSKKVNLFNSIKFINGEWPDINVVESDVSICGYSLGGKVGTVEGIKRVLELTKKIGFFIVPYSKEQTDFSSKDLYSELGIEPPKFDGCYIDTLNIFDQLNEDVSYEIIDNDFGMPLESIESLPEYARYLSEKLGIPDSKKMENHLKTIITKKNTKIWIPNYRKSVMIIWKRS